MNAEYALAHQRLGHGAKIIVLLHGFLGRSRNLASLATALVSRVPDCSVISIDLPGHGRSPPLTPDEDYAAVIDLFAGWFRTLPAPMTLIGHSLGAKMGLSVAARLGAAVESLVMLDASPSPAEGIRSDVDWIVELLLAAPARASSSDAMRTHFHNAGLPRGTTDWLLMNLRHDGDLVTWAIDRLTLAKFAKQFRVLDQWHDAESIADHLAVVQGGASPYITESDIIRFHALGVEVHTLPHVGHFVHVEALDDLVNWFVARR